MNKSNHLRSKHFRLQQLTKSTYAAIAEDGGSAICNAGIIDLGGQIVVFDTFLTPQAAMDLQLMTEELFGRKPQIVVNSHYHNDHIWGNQVFIPGSQIISSVRTRELITTAEWKNFNGIRRTPVNSSSLFNLNTKKQPTSNYGINIPCGLGIMEVFWRQYRTYR